VLGQGIDVNDIGRFDAMQDQVHDGDDIGEAFLFLAVEGSGLQGFELAGGQFTGLFIFLATPMPEIIIGFAQKARRATGAIIDALANLWLHHLYHGADKWLRCVVLTPVTPGVTHVFDLGLVDMGWLVLFFLRVKTERIDILQRIAQ
jgi:hypothetical protein